jgi:hypothetical protein
VTNAAATVTEFKASVRNTRGTVLIGEQATAIRVPGGEASVLDLPYQVEPGLQTVSLTVTRTSDGAVLYANDVQVRRPGKEPPRRVWQVSDPLYEVLLSDEPTGLVRDGAMYWMPEIDHGKFWLFANQYGERYVKAEMYDLLVRQRLRPLHNSYVRHIHLAGATIRHPARACRRWPSQARRCPCVYGGMEDVDRGRRSAMGSR